MTPQKHQSIKWEVTGVHQGFMVRFGKKGKEFYKQHLPGGIVDEHRYPPKRMSERAYQQSLRVIDIHKRNA